MIGMKDGTSGKPSIHYDSGEFQSEGVYSKRYSIPNGINAGLLRHTYRDWEGSLVWLHMQEPLRWPYSTLCGDYSDNDFNEEDYLEIDEGKALMAKILTHVMAIRVAKDFAVSPPTITNWKLGRTRAPKEIVNYYNHLSRQKA